MAASLPHSLFRADQVRAGEQKIARDLGIDLYALMERAGSAVFETLTLYWPGRCRLLVCCGGGNNGGDGYVIARLAKKAGWDVTVWAMSAPETLTGEAAVAYTHWNEAGGTTGKPDRGVEEYDLVVDALIGTGLSRQVSDRYAALIALINQSGKPVLAVDIPSGLDADTGAVLGAAVAATVTVTLVAMKQGLLTGLSRDYCGSLVFSGLGIGDNVEAYTVPSAWRIDAGNVARLPVRQRCAHKGHFGRALCLGGAPGMGGAMILCATAALRTGAGIVEVVTHPAHVPPLLGSRPEVMAGGWLPEQPVELIEARIEQADVLMLGPGLGQSAWSHPIFQAVMGADKPLVLDADGLNLLANAPQSKTSWILTPHPGEAARLLGETVSNIEQDRFSAVQKIQGRYGGVVVLKGAGTIVYDGERISVIDTGNPGMASGGMGDVLTGVIGALLAQHLSLYQAACLGCYLHGYAADIAATSGERGMAASDLLPFIRQGINNFDGSI